MCLASDITVDNINQYYNGTFGALQVQAQEGRHRFDRLFNGDGWDSAGFTGEVPADVHYSAATFNILQWSFKPVQQVH